MKWILILAVILLGIYAFVMTDRDRSLWVLNTAIKTVTSPNIIADVAYGTSDWQKLDVYPALNKEAPAPVLVFIHGGGWQEGRKEQYFFAADAFLRLGYTVVLPDYIKYPSVEARFPAHIQDVAKAVAWVKNNIETYGGDPNSIFISGHSAGAHTVALLATDIRYLNAQGLAKQAVSGVAPIAGPFKFIPDDPAEMAVFGPETNYPNMDPLRFISGDEPPVLILHSDRDKAIANRHPRELEAALKAAGQDVESRIYEDYSHADMVTHLHPWFAGDDTIAMEIDRFFKKHMAPTISDQKSMNN